MDRLSADGGCAKAWPRAGLERARSFHGGPPPSATRQYMSASAQLPGLPCAKEVPSEHEFVSSQPRRRARLQRAGERRARHRPLHEHAPEFDVLVVDDGSTDETARRAPRRRARRVLRHAVQPRHRRRGPGRLRVRARERLRLHGPGRRRRPARPRPDRQAHRRDGRRTDARHGVRLALPRRTSTGIRRRSAAAPASTSSRSCCRASSASA